MFSPLIAMMTKPDFCSQLYLCYLAILECGEGAIVHGRNELAYTQFK